MRLLFISGSFPPVKCGVGDYVYTLANAIACHRDVKVGILTSSMACRSDINPAVEVFPIISTWGINSLSMICNFIKSWAPDIVHIQYPCHGYSLLPGRLRALSISLLPFLAFKKGKRVVLTWHEYVVGTKAIIYSMLEILIPSHIVVVRPKYLDHIPFFLRIFLRLKKLMYIPNASSIQRIGLSPKARLDKRLSYLKGAKRLIVFFGFIYFHKGVDLIFKIANPKTDRVIIAGGYDDKDEYISSLMALANSTPWQGNVEFLGFAPSEEVSSLLSVADAAIFPFRGEGGGEWNSSLHAAISHNIFVLSTSSAISGYDPARNIYFAQIENTQEMKTALDTYAGIRLPITPSEPNWDDIGDLHIRLYGSLLKTR